MFTGLLIALLAIVGAGIVVYGGVAALSRRPDTRLPGGSNRLLGDGRDGVERGLADIRVGDVIQREATDYLVEGVIHYDEDGHRWRAARLVDGRDVAWLLVGQERGGAVTIRLMREDTSITIDGYPPEQLSNDEHTFSQERRGTATTKISGDAGQLPGTDSTTGETVLRCRWWRYETAGPATLIIEQWGSVYRVLVGQTLKPDDVELIPGS
jgi:hypothetical protein